MTKPQIRARCVSLTSLLQQAGRHQWNPSTFDIPFFLPDGLVLLWLWFWSYFKVLNKAVILKCSRMGSSCCHPQVWLVACHFSLLEHTERRQKQSCLLLRNGVCESRSLSLRWETYGALPPPALGPALAGWCPLGHPSSSVPALRPQRLLSSQQTDSSHSRNGTAAAWKTWISSFSSENHSELQLALSVRANPTVEWNPGYQLFFGTKSTSLSSWSQSSPTVWNRASV